MFNLPFILKILEKAVAQLFCSYLHKNNIYGIYHTVNTHKLSHYTVTLVSFSVLPCMEVNHGVIVDSSLSFKTHVDNITRTAFFKSQKYVFVHVNCMQLISII